MWFHGRALAASLDVNPAVLAWFAFLHDSQRHHKHRDPQHGTRAAHFAVHLCTEHGRREETLRVAVRMGRGMGEASAAASRLKVCRELRLP